MLKIIVFVFRRQELRDLRLLQKEEHRAQTVLSAKLLAQREQMQRHFDQEMNVSHSHTHTSCDAFVSVCSLWCSWISLSYYI